MSLWRALLVIAITALAAACASAPGSEEASLPPLPEAFSTVQDGARPSPEAWWNSLGDPVLGELVEEALAGSPDVLAAAARVDRALAQARIARSAVLPSFDAGLEASERKQNFIGLPIPGSDGVLSSESTTVGISLNLSWELDLWGRIRAGRDAAAAGVGAAWEDYLGVRLSLAGQVAKSWFALVEADAQVEAAQETLSNRSLTRRRIEQRYRLGLRGALDLRLARTNEAAAEASLVTRRRIVERLSRQLETLLARYPGGVLAARAAHSELPQLPPGPPAGVPAELLSRRPDLRAAEKRLRAAGFDVQAARTALFPRLVVSRSAGYQGEDLDDLFDDDFSVWSLAGSLLQPLFQAGRLRAGVRASQAEFEALAYQYVRTALTAFAETETALASERLLEERVLALEAARRESLAARDLAEERYAAGLVDYLSVLAAEQEATLAHIQLLAARRELLDNRIDLHLALGGGLQPTTETSG